MNNQPTAAQRQPSKEERDRDVTATPQAGRPLALNPLIDEANSAFCKQLDDEGEMHPDDALKLLSNLVQAA